MQFYYNIEDYLFLTAGCLTFKRYIIKGYFHPLGWQVWQFSQKKWQRVVEVGSFCTWIRTLKIIYCPQKNPTRISFYLCVYARYVCL